MHLGHSVHPAFEDEKSEVSDEKSIKKDHRTNNYYKLCFIAVRKYQPSFQQSTFIPTQAGCVELSDMKYSIF